MARSLKPYSNTYGERDVGPTSFNMNDPTQAARRDYLYTPSSEDPRLTGEQRIDQRYQNFTFGSYDAYAQDKAWEMQQQGAGARDTLTGLGQQAWDTGAGIQGRATPGTDYSAANATMGQQGDLYSQLQAYGNQGPGASKAQADLAANTAAARRFALSQAGSGRGAGGGASAMRGAMMQNAITQGQANAAAGSLEAQEQDLWRQRQLQAYGMGGDVLSDVAGQQSQNAQFLTQAELEAQAQRDQAGLAYQQLGADTYGKGYGAQLMYEQEGRANFENELEAGMGYENNVNERVIGQMNADAARAGAEDPSTMDTILGVASVAAPLMVTLSDEDEKKGVKGTDLSDTYRAMGGSENKYDFTDEGWMQTGPEGYMKNHQQWERMRDEQRMKEEQERRWKELERERDAANAAKDAKRAQVGSALGQALGGLREFV